MSAIRWVCCSLILCCVIQTSKSRQNTDVLVLTVASDETDGFKRYLRSIQIYDFTDKVEILGMGKPWRGGDMKHPGGGYKVNLLKDKLKEFKDDCDKIILFTDSYDVIFLAKLDEIVERFKSTNARILFAAEYYCWPDASLAKLYPPVDRGQAYLNSGGIIGYAMDLYAIISSASIDDREDDQLFYTRIYLDAELRQKHAIQLDHQSQLFQNLFGASDDIQWSFENDEAYLYNKAYNTRPLIVHGNGRSKLMLNSLGNYLARAWSPTDGCRSCQEGKITLNPQNVPKILLAIFITHPAPFLEEFLEKIHLLHYPKAKLDIFIYNNEEFHEKHVGDWIEKYGQQYSSLKTIVPADKKNVAAAQELGMDLCLRKECAALFYVDSLAHLDNPDTLKLLLEQNRGIVAPLLVRPEQSWSNFWGAIADNGYYARSLDYMDIISGKRKGLWNVPYIHHCYLINATIIANPKTRPLYTKDDLDPEMAFASTNRQRDVFMFVNNLFEFGHLVNADDFDVKLANPDLYELLNNKIDWELRYIHENYSKTFEKDHIPIQPCPDVYWFPIVNTRFTREFIDVMETFGLWSDGSNEDSRLQGGYENVPTRDIHMNQVNFERQWLFFLKEYVRPLQELVFIGYFHDPPRSLMNFVVRYRPDEQPSLRPHHDSSTYTINIALNQRGIDYEGGGCRFLRYDCAVTDTKPGWMLMHPGRLTHYHEGLKVTNGTRYIMISFVDP